MMLKHEYAWRDTSRYGSRTHLSNIMSYSIKLIVQGDDPARIMDLITRDVDNWVQQKARTDNRIKALEAAKARKS